MSDMTQAETELRRELAKAAARWESWREVLRLEREHAAERLTTMTSERDEAVNLYTAEAERYRCQSVEFGKQNLSLTKAQQEIERLKNNREARITTPCPSCAAMTERAEQAEQFKADLLAKMTARGLSGSETDGDKELVGDMLFILLQRRDQQLTEAKQDIERLRVIGTMTVEEHNRIVTRTITAMDAERASFEQEIERLRGVESDTWEKAACVVESQAGSLTRENTDGCGNSDDIAEGAVNDALRYAAKTLRQQALAGTKEGA